MLLVEDPKIAKFKSRLKKMRIMRGFTQESLAEISNVNIKSIAAYEQNPEKLLSASAGTILKLADAMNCDMEDLINKDLIPKEN